ncbi:hypothetical protein LMG28727_07640 [Paraburkholderia kirstenboschensis]|nr:hypothetical protein LMG28727_07640 [Paraburkholderia kirstenboschensis]
MHQMAYANTNCTTRPAARLTIVLAAFEPEDQPLTSRHPDVLDYFHARGLATTKHRGQLAEGSAYMPMVEV